jgi:hypothetical protein
VSQDAVKATVIGGTEQEQQGQEPGVTIPTFRLSSYWKLPRGTTGLTRMDSKRLCASEALEWVLDGLPEDAVTVDENTDANGDVTTIRIDWSKVPAEIRYPFEHGVKRR